jgi:hypothetical protein
VNPSARLFVLLARKSPRAAIFRRGPSKQVQLIAWDRDCDRFTPGQWIKARIYERRCDLSPDGDLVIYFAAKHLPPFGTWTAVSRPPYFTALALWPKGDCWGGGGLFDAANRIALNHWPNQMQIADDFRLSKGMQVRPFGTGSGWGEDFPIWFARMKRDSWKCTHEGDVRKNDLTAGIGWEYDPPITWQRPHPISKKSLLLEMQIHGIHERNGGWYVIRYVVRRPGEKADNLGRTDWADWDMNGDLIFSQAGALYRCPFQKGALEPSEEAVQLADFSANRFENVEPPASALRW